MPNWCNNTLVVTGSKKEVKKFYNKGVKVENNILTWRMSNYLPIPKALRNTKSPAPEGDEMIMVNQWDVDAAKRALENGKDVIVPELIECNNSTKKQRKALIKKYGVADWYDWCVNYWGTKWDCSGDIFNYSGDYFDVYFESAWSPPTIWLQTVAQKYPNLTFVLTYMETGMWFAGKMVCNGNNVSEEDGEPKHTDDEGNKYIYNDGCFVNVATNERIDEETGYDFIYATNPFE